jgi:hypothetical protein
MCRYGRGLFGVPEALVSTVGGLKLDSVAAVVGLLVWFIASRIMAGASAGSLGIGEDAVGGVDAGDIGIFEVAYVVVADQIEARSLLALEKGGSLEVKGRVPMVMLNDLPGAEVPRKVGIFRSRAEQY